MLKAGQIPGEMGMANHYGNRQPGGEADMEEEVEAWKSENYLNILQFDL